MDVRTCPRACPPPVPVGHRLGVHHRARGMGGPASSSSSSTWDAGRLADRLLCGQGSVGIQAGSSACAPQPPPRGPVSARCGVPVGPWDERSPEACRPPCSDAHHIGLAVPSRRATPNRASAPRASARFAELFGYLLTPPVSPASCPPRALSSWRKTGSVWAAKGYQSLR